jgi:hypothetical protein
MAPSGTPMTTTVTWTGGAGTTNWTDAANWSTDALPGAGDDVVINVATATTIQIAYANVSIDSLTTNAQISVGLAASLSAATLNASANVLLEGGTIANTTINMSPGSALVGSAYPGGTLDGVTASGLLDMSNAGIDIADGLTLNNATMLLGDTNGTTFGTLWFTNTETLGGTGTIILGNDSPPDGPTATNAFDLDSPSSTVTIGPGITIRGNSATFQGYNIGTFTNAGTFINQGTIAADASVAPGSFGYDTGYSFGSTATFATAINTTGVTNPAPQQVYQSMRYGLGFGYKLSGLTPGASYAVRLDFASLWNIGAGTQAFNVSINGTQVLSNYDVYAAAGGLDKATAQQFTAVANANGQILLNFASVKYEAQINGIEVLSGNTQVETVAAGSLPGGITFGIVQDNEPPIFINDGTLDASNGETLSINGPWTNAAGATINASGATLSLGDPTGYYDPWSNSGTITVTGSTLNLGGLFTLPGMGTFNQSANTVNLVGMLDNTGTTLALSPATGSWVLDGGTLKNGTLTETGGAELEFTTSGTLDGVTVDGNLDLTGDSSAAQPDVDVADADVIDGLVLNGTANLGNASGTTYGRLFFNNNETLSGTGTVVFGTNVLNELSGNTSWMFPTTLTIGPGIAVLGSDGSIQASSIVNQGTIIAEVPGLTPSPDTITVGSDVTNEGTIEAMTGETLTIYNCTNTAGSTISATGARLNLSGALMNEPGGSITATGSTVTLGDPSFTSTTNWSNSGSITVTNSTLDLGGVFTLAGMGVISQSGDIVNLVGTLDNTGTTLALNAATGSWNLEEGILENGTLTETGGAELVITGSGGTLDGVTVDGILDLTGSLTSRPYNGEVYATVLDGMALDGTAYLGNASGSIGGELDFNNTETLSGAGTIVFGKSNNWLNSQYSSAGLTIGPGIVVHGSSGVVAGWSQYSALTDEGPIIVDNNGAAAALGPFVPDRLLSGSATDQFTTNPIDTSAVSNPAPQAVYQTANFGNFAYTLPNLTPGVTYTVRLDFAELQASAAGQRQMNVSINGTQVLTNFDIFATAGAQYKAIAESFSAIANAQGQIVINFAAASRWLLPASVNAIELYSGTTRLLAIDSGGFYADGVGVFPAGLGNGTPTPFYLNDPGYLSVPQGGVIDLSGSLLGNTHNASQYQVVGTLSVSGGTASTPQLFEAMSNDLGAVPAGFINNFADGTLDFGAGGYTQLVDQSRNSGSTQPEAVYAYNLVVEPGATLNLNGLHLYVGSEEVAGTIVGGTVTVVTLPTPAVNAPASAAVNENSTLAFTGTRSLSISDPSGTAEQVTLSASHGTLSVTATPGVTITGNGTGIVLITGQIGNVNSAVGSLVYTPTPGYTGADVLTLSDQNQADGELGSASVAITVNAPPSIAAPAAASLSENGSYTFAGGSIALTDAAASGSSDSLTLLVSNGTLTLGSATGLTFSSGANGTSSMTVTGTLANLNAALSGLTYKPASGYTGSATLAISLFDSVDGLSASANVAFTIINSPPSITAPSTAAVVVTSTLTFLTANKNAVSISDVSAGTAVEPLTLTATNGTLTLGSTTGITFSSGTNNSASMTINGTLANLNAALSGLTFKPATIGTATVVLSYTDVGDGLLASATITITVSKGITKFGAGSAVSLPASPAAVGGASLSGPTGSGATSPSIAGDLSNSSMPPDEETTQWAGVTAAVAVLNG